MRAPERDDWTCAFCHKTVAFEAIIQDGVDRGGHRGGVGACGPVMLHGKRYSDYVADDSADLNSAMHDNQKQSGIGSDGD